MSAAITAVDSKLLDVNINEDLIRRAREKHKTEQILNIKKNFIHEFLLLCIEIQSY